LNLDNLQFIKKVKPVPFGIDVNSGFEIEPGVKDLNKLKDLFSTFKNQN
jgi:phosphoribosylanthranilate isomerase